MQGTRQLLVASIDYSPASHSKFVDITQASGHPVTSGGECALALPAWQESITEGRTQPEVAFHQPSNPLFHLIIESKKTCKWVAHGWHTTPFQDALVCELQSAAAAVVPAAATGQGCPACILGSSSSQNCSKSSTASRSHRGNCVGNRSRLQVAEAERSSAHKEAATVANHPQNHQLQQCGEA